MKDLKAIDHIKTAIAVIDKNMTVVEANNAYKQRNKLNKNVVGTKCFSAAYQFNHNCTCKSDSHCPATESFKTKKPSSTIHHFWIDEHAVVEEIQTTPIIEENGNVNYVVEEFRDITELLGLNKGIVSICSYCRKVRDKNGQWVAFETYLHKNTKANVSHGMCQECKTSLTTK